MSRLVNLEILGRPINILVVLVIIALWYFGAFAVFTRANSN